MKKIKSPKKETWKALIKRPAMNLAEMNDLVEQIFLETERKGDRALKKYTKIFDHADLDNLQITSAEMDKSSSLVPDDLKNAIQLAFENIQTFHSAQKETKQVIETMEGVSCWRESRPIEKVGMYVPGGSAPLFSTVLMLGIPAKLAGCNEIMLCTPPNKEGKIDPVILYCAKLIGLDRVFVLGGIQAIAALALGTESVPKVDKIFGPGNQYVTAAKQYAQKKGAAIDFPAGPSELLVIADKSVDPRFVAADLLSQAEHGADSQVVLLSDDEDIVEAINREVGKQMANLPRRAAAVKAMRNSMAIVFGTIRECVEYSNFYAPEHLILAMENAMDHVSKITSAGSVFVGKYSCESIGDYASGTNHTLPTNGFSRSYSGVSLDSFVKKITFQEITSQGIKNIGPAVARMAEAEGLYGHKNAVNLRLKSK